IAKSVQISAVGRISIADAIFIQKVQERFNSSWWVVTLDHKAFVFTFGAAAALLEIFFEFIYHSIRVFGSDFNSRKSGRMVVDDAVFQGKGVAFCGKHPYACTP